MIENVGMNVRRPPHQWIMNAWLPAHDRREPHAPPEGGLDVQVRFPSGPAAMEDEGLGERPADSRRIGAK